MKLTSIILLGIIFFTSSMSAQVTVHHEESLFGASFLKNKQGDTRYFNFNGRTPSVDSWFSTNPLALAEYQAYEKYSNRAFWLNVTCALSGLTFIGAGIFFSAGGHSGSSSAGGAVMTAGLIGFLLPLPFMLYSMNAAEHHLYNALNVLNGLEKAPQEPISAIPLYRTEYVAFYQHF